MKVDRLLERYCELSAPLRMELLATVAGYINQGKTVEFQNESYHHIEDLTVDIEAYCNELSITAKQVIEPIRQ